MTYRLPATGRQRDRIVAAIKRAIESIFTESDWEEFGYLTGTRDFINAHPRLYRSMRFGDPDYGNCVFDALEKALDQDSENLDVIVESFGILDWITNNSPSTLNALRGLADPAGSLGVEHASTKQAPLIERLVTRNDLAENDSPADVSTVFVMMPFSDPLNRYYEPIIAAAVRDVGLLPVRADEIYSTQSIISDIFASIKNSAIVVAELTGKNPNVLYELGLGHGLDRPAILITQSMDDVPFDLKHRRCIVYDTKSVEWADDLRSRIVKTLRAVMTDLDSARFSRGL